jgi:hypothetical protein
MRCRETRPTSLAEPRSAGQKNELRLIREHKSAGIEVTSSSISSLQPCISALPTTYSETKKIQNASEDASVCEAESYQMFQSFHARARHGVLFYPLPLSVRAIWTLAEILAWLVRAAYEQSNQRPCGLLDTRLQMKSVWKKRARASHHQWERFF